MYANRKRQKRTEVGIKEKEEAKAKKRILVHFIPAASGTGGTNTDRRV